MLVILSISLMFFLFGFVFISMGMQYYIGLVVCWCISAGLFFAYRLFKSEYMKGEEFEEWLLNNRKDVEYGIAVYNGYPVTLYTELKRFEAIVSLVFFSKKYYSRYLFKNLEAGFLEGLVFSLVNLIFGWWELSAIISTIAALFKNITGGQKIKVRDIYKEYDDLLEKEMKKKLKKQSKIRGFC